MSIRWKYLIILLVFSLLPLAALAWWAQDGVLRLGDEIAGEITTELTQLVGEEIARFANEQASLFNEERKSLETALVLLAREFPWHAAESPGERVAFFRQEDFLDPARAPADLRQDAAYAPEPGMAASALISLSQPAFAAPGGAAPEAVGRDVERVLHLLPSMRAAYDQEKGLIHRIAVRLESGLLAYYPGQGGLPEGYDPTRRPWYAAALRANGAPAWTYPHRDALTGRSTMSVSAAIRDAADRLLGVVSLDMLVAESLSGRETAAQWASRMRAFLAASGDPVGDAEGGLSLLAKGRALENGRMAWSGVAGDERLFASGSRAFRDFLTAMKTMSPGWMLLPYEGEERIWAFAPVARGLYLVVVVPRDVAEALPLRIGAWVENLARNQRAALAAAVLGIVALCAVFAYFWSRTWARVILTLAAAFRRLAAGDFAVRLSIRTNDERNALVESFNEMVPQLQDRVRVRQALDLAREVQQNLLPRDNPVLPGWDVAAKSVYCEETGGDYFDFIPADGPDGDLALVVGDISGHGLAPALLMAGARAALRGLSTVRPPLSLAERMAALNALLYRDMEASSRFMTLYLLEISPACDALRWVRAGHDPAELLEPGREDFELLQGSGLVLGVMEDAPYQVNERPLPPPGAVLVLGTDGIWETFDASGEAYGKERLRAVVLENRDKGAAAILEAVFADLAAFRGDGPQEDDVTLAVVKRATG